jgi:outer membrane receptor protein involved in Fe transport
MRINKKPKKQYVMRSWWISICVVIFVPIAILPATTLAQSGVAGVVKDTSGGVLPNVSVEVASPALIKEVPAVETDGEGQYKIIDLPPGVYTVTFSLTGFKTFKREGVKLSSGFTATVNAEMSVAALRQTVMVTAREREEDPQKVPLSIAVYNDDSLQEQSVQRLSDLAQVTPNFFYGQKIQSGSSAGQIYIRGIGQQDTNVQFSSGVGIYVDGVYLGRAQANDLDMADVERVEVLYGPQGTLFGKNSNGGALNIVTKSPDPAAKTPSGMVEIQTGNFGRFNARGLLNLPLTNKAAMQVAAAGWRQDGYSVRINGQDQANQNRIVGRVQLLLKPSDELEALLRVDGTAFDEQSAAYRLVEVRETSPIPILYASMTPFRYDNRWVTKSDFHYNGTGPNKNSGDVWGTSLTLTWNRSWGRVEVYYGLSEAPRGKRLRPGWVAAHCS